MEGVRSADSRVRKRKASGQDFSNERLSKRLELLNLENASTPYISIQRQPETKTPNQAQAHPSRSKIDDDVMQLDDTKDKVYIYNLDDELSDIESEEDENKVIFLPDIERKLRQTKIPPSVLANKEGELAGMNLSTALVLYDIPSSLTVSADKDSVRKAIIESRARAQEKQRKEREIARTMAPASLNGASKYLQLPKLPEPFSRAHVNGAPPVQQPVPDDPDVMEID